MACNITSARAVILDSFLCCVPITVKKHFLNEVVLFYCRNYGKMIKIFQGQKIHYVILGPILKIPMFHVQFCQQYRLLAVQFIQLIFTDWNKLNNVSHSEYVKGYSVLLRRIKFLNGARAHHYFLYQFLLAPPLCF